jgi:hypothetical protein
MAVGLLRVSGDARAVIRKSSQRGRLDRRSSTQQERELDC